MLLAKVLRQYLLPSAILLLASTTFLSGCRTGVDPLFLGTYPMGEKVQVGPLAYQILESHWRNELGSGGRTPKQRYLFVKLSVSNTSGAPVSVPGFSLQGSGKEDMHSEISEDMDKVENWFGLLRNIGPSQTEQGWIVFDVPMAAYKFVATDGGEVDQEKYAHIDIPVNLE